MQAAIKAFLNKFSDTETDNEKLWFLNENIGLYLNGTGANDIGDLLYKDIIETPGTSATSTYQTGVLDVPKVKRNGGGNSWLPTHIANTVDGTVNVPSKSAIIDEIYYLMKKDGATPSPDRSTIESYFNRSVFNTSTHEGKARLACINDMINAGNAAEIYYSYILTGTDFTSIGKYTTDYNITVGGGSIEPTYGETPRDVLKDTIYDWDTSDPAVAQDIAIWKMAKKGIQVVSEADASSPTYLKNYIEGGFGVLTTFEPANVSKFSGLSSDEIARMDDQQYEDLMGIKNTSIAVTTSVIEVPDETNVKKAEAEYEAKMRKINQKDAKYDKQLSVCETERQAIKDEMETLKTVIKDNVNLNFKLFS